MHDRGLQSDDLVKRVEAQLLAMGPRYLQNKKREFEALDLQHLDLEKVGQLGHRVKGSAKTYGFEALGKLGAELEAACKQQDRAAAAAEVERIREFIRSIRPLPPSIA